MNDKTGLRGFSRWEQGGFVAALILSLGFSLPALGQAINANIAYSPDKGPILLLGEWERYDGYLTEEGITSAAGIPAIADVPIREGLVPSPPLQSGKYSYHLLVSPSGPPAEREYAFALPGIDGYRAVLVDSHQLYDSSSGAPSPSMYYFRAAGDRISIIVQCVPGGRLLEHAPLVPSNPVFGEVAAIGRGQTLASAGAFSLMGFFLVQGILVLAMFAFWRKNLEFLSFAAYLVATAVFTYFKNGAILHGLPGLSSVQAIETGYAIAMDFQYLGLTLFLVSLFHHLLPRQVSVAVLVPPVLLSCAVLVLPSHLDEVYEVSWIYFGLFLLASLVFIANHAFRGARRARWMALSLIPPTAGFAFRLLAPASLLGAWAIEPAGHLVFAFISMLMLVKKVADSFESVETLSDYVSSVSRTMSSFIPKEFLEYLDKTDVTDLRLGDHVRKKMTIFFSDIRAFTSLSERLTVEENFAFINSYLSRVVPIIRENGGFVDKYIGDAIMALYSGSAGADQAIRSAIAMQAKIVEYNGHRAKMGYAPISMGVGIHTGDLMLGVVGVHDRMENTVISDSVNLASRLQAITKAFNISLAISEQSFKELEDPGSYKYRFIGKVKVKGKAAPVSVFEIFDGIAAELFERKMKANTFFEQGMLSYYQKDFAGAMYYFKRVLDITPEDGASGFYLDNCMNKASL